MSQAMSRAASDRQAAEKAQRDLPAVKRGKGRPPKGFAFSELIEKVGGETVSYHGLDIPRRELVVRIMFELLEKGVYTFPDGREMVAEPDRWLSLFWEVVKHTEVTAVNRWGVENGTLVGGATVNTQVVLYLPNNQREVVGQLSTYTDGVTPKAIPDLAELSPDADDDTGELIVEADNDPTRRRVTIVADDFTRIDELPER